MGFSKEENRKIIECREEEMGRGRFREKGKVF
jgi:hypothetical protein